MKFFIKFSLIIFLLLLPTSCAWFQKLFSRPFIGLASPDIPEGTPAFRKGFKDGCSTGQFSRGNEFYRASSSFQFDPKMIGNPEYRFGHQRGYSICFYRFAGSEGPNTSFDRVLNPYGYDTTFNAQDINTTWGGAFDGLDSSLKGSNAGFNGIFDIWSGGSGGGVFSANPLWAGGSKGQIFGQ